MDVDLHGAVRCRWCNAYLNVCLAVQGDLRGALPLERQGDLLNARVGGEDLGVLRP